MKYSEIDTDKNEVMKKYALAGKIRFISFSLLVLFLLLLKGIGGYFYLNSAFIALIFVEAVVNQPYPFIMRRVDLRRFYYYQMTIDIIAISWIQYYMGGIEAPIISMAYYAIILWAGFASTTAAVFFAVTVSSVLFSGIVLSEHFGFLPLVTYSGSGYVKSTQQMISLLIGNVSFLFAFGYFSAYSARVIRSLQKKRQEEELRSAHRLIAAGYLVGQTAHDALNCIGIAGNYSRLLSDPAVSDAEKSSFPKSIEELLERSAELISKIGRFSREGVAVLKPIDMHTVIESAIELTSPIVRYSKMTIEKSFASDMPLIIANSSEITEVLVALIFNALDATSKEGRLVIKTVYERGKETAAIIFSDTGVGMTPEDLKRLGELFFNTKAHDNRFGLGLATAYGIIDRHNGKLDADSTVGKGTTFTIHLPVYQAGQSGNSTS